jgi:hypothetical protein
MANNICIQSSVTAHQQSGFNAWQQLLHKQFKAGPKHLRPMTEGEKEFAHVNSKTLVGLYSRQQLEALCRHDMHIEYVPTGMLTLRFEFEHYRDNDGDRSYNHLQFRYCFVHINREKIETQITEYSRFTKIRS